MQINFGKYRGQDLTQIPKDYLRWLTNPVTKSGTFKVSPAIQEEARRILSQEEEPIEETRDYSPTRELEMMSGEFKGLAKENILKIMDEIITYLKDKRQDIGEM